MSYTTYDPFSSGTTDGPDERHLVIQAQKGDQTAFELLYERYNVRICRYLIRMVGNDGIGCELTQETFLKAWKSLLSLRDPSRFVGWLYRIATNCAYSYRQRERLVRTVPWEECESDREQLSVAGPEKQVEDSELMKLVLARVSPTYRPCLILYVIEKLSQRQIADLLGIKESCVSKYVSRGREEFRQIYYRLVNEQVPGGKGQGR